MDNYYNRKYSRTDFNRGSLGDRANACLIKSIFNKKMPGGTVLDVGCGTGYYSNLIQHAGNYQVTGIDYSQVATDRAKSKYNCNFTCADFWDYPVENKYGVGCQ